MRLLWTKGAPLPMIGGPPGGPFFQQAGRGAWHLSAKSAWDNPTLLQASTFRAKIMTSNNLIGLDSAFSRNSCTFLIQVQSNDLWKAMMSMSTPNTREKKSTGPVPNPLVRNVQAGSGCSKYNYFSLNQQSYGKLNTIECKIYHEILKETEIVVF
jgi:hypothetical protein